LHRKFAFPLSIIWGGNDSLLHYPNTQNPNSQKAGDKKKNLASVHSLLNFMEIKNSVRQRQNTCVEKCQACPKLSPLFAGQLT
jgi:hypothetical protein